MKKGKSTYFYFTGKCRKCGNAAQFIISSDESSEFKRAMKCVYCGNSPSQQDVERFWHLTDTLTNMLDRNDLIDIESISVQGL